MMKLFRLSNIFLFFMILNLTVGPAHADPLVEVQDMIARHEYTTALEHLEKLIREEPENADARFLRGVIYAQSGDHDQAINVFQDMTIRFPKLSEPYNNLAVLHAAEGDYEQARKVLLKATEIQPNYATAHANLGDVYTKLAAIAYRRAYSLDPQNQQSGAKSRDLENLLQKGDQSKAPSTATTGTNEIGLPIAETPVPAPPTDEAAEESLLLPRNSSAPPREPVPTDSGKCFSIGPLGDKDPVTQMEEWLQEQGLAVTGRADKQRQLVNYKVYLPPLENRDQARESIAELKRKGVKDLFIIPTGELKNGISLGVYSREASVKRRSTELNSIGYKTLVMPRYNTQSIKWLDITQSEKSQFDPAVFNQQFPKQQITSGACNH
ncbi:MAG: tetratricopeptide repeat protein [Gammaproteobacteria bacterium]|nr:tetratricopeptide repeat protein [Gammaproteobacteria bacterium]